MAPDVEELLRGREDAREMLDARVARAAYDAYAMHTGGRTFDGNAMAAWGDLPERIRAAWVAAVRAGSAERQRAIGEAVEKFRPRGDR